MLALAYRFGSKHSAGWRVDPEAFGRALARPDRSQLICTLNHEPGILLGTEPNGLRAWVEPEVGLAFAVAHSWPLAPVVGASFQFDPIPDAIEIDSDGSAIYHEIDLVELAVITHPFKPGCPGTLVYGNPLTFSRAIRQLREDAA